MSNDGECIVTRIDSRLRIDRADPVIHIAPSMLAWLQEKPADGVTFNGETLRIEGTNRTVVYRIREADEPGPLYYIGEWPD